MRAVETAAEVTAGVVTVKEAVATAAARAEEVMAVGTAAVVRVVAMVDERSAVHSLGNPCQRRTVPACRTGR